MPREGEGHVADNAVESGENLVHGAGKVSDSHVDRANKAAPPPEPEKGGALEGFDASGGGSTGIGGQTGDGKGDVEPMASKTTGGGETK
ncbi:hypothetical protein LTS18_000358 [Coniosporium uncinatum]|uniref:Uncharacterized protein n=1 Tax=Coniosporium uncinatum TaxID=93489 RepID=A0ACC3D8L4_9PEZI|nr:hypothetical protein LTS18_000358 [Coniosporium uncinatum]